MKVRPRRGPFLPLLQLQSSEAQLWSVRSWEAISTFQVYCVWVGDQLSLFRILLI